MIGDGAKKEKEHLHREGGRKRRKEEEKSRGKKKGGTVFGWPHRRKEKRIQFVGGAF